MESPQPAGQPRATGLPPGVEPGPLGSRFVAYLIDAGVGGVISGVLAGVGSAVGGGAGTALSILGSVLALGWLGYVAFTLGTQAASPGLKVMNLQVVGFSDGRPIGIGRAALRLLIVIALGVTGIGMIIMLILLLLHPRHQGWQDLASNAVVIRARAVAPPKGADDQYARPANAGDPYAVDQGHQPAAYDQGGYDQGQMVGGYDQGGYDPGATAPVYGTQPSPYGQPQPDPYVYPGQQLPQQSTPEYGQPTQEYGAAPTGYPPTEQPVAPDLNRPLYRDEAPAAPGSPYGDAAAYGSPAVPAAPPVTPLSAPYGSPALPAPVQVPAPLPIPAPLPVPAPGVPGAPTSSSSAGSATPPPLSPSAQGWSVTLDDGRPVTVIGPVLLGRNPQPDPGEEHAQLIKIADQTRTVSKTHLRISVDDTGLYVTDLGSTNGSTVTTIDGVSRRCPAGDRVRVSEGNIVSIGDHWFEVARS